MAGPSIGKRIVVKTHAGKQRHELIVTNDDGGCTVMPDKRTTPVQIAYNDVLKVGPNLSRGAKIAIIVAVEAAVVITVFVIAMLTSENM